MKQKKLAVSVLVILLALLITWVAYVFAAPPDAEGAPSRDVPEVAQADPGWQQVNNNGFGDPDAGEASALEVFNGHLYAGTDNATDGARIFRSPDGVTWAPVSEPGFGIPHDTAPPAILDLAVFKSYLYASTGRGGDPGKIWRTNNGTYWAPVVNNGFGNADTVDITALAEFDGLLYAAATNRIDGVQVWRSYTGDSNSWTQDTTAVLVPEPARISGFAVLGSALYAAVESDGPAQIWRTYGGEWAVINDGFGDEQTTLTGGLAVFGGYLYVGAGNPAGGPQLWRSSDGDVWTPVMTPASDDPDNVGVQGVFVSESRLYLTVQNAVTGLEVWRSANGTTWEQSNLDGFGDAGNSTSNGSNAMANFLSRLFIGTMNVAAGGELWRLTPADLPVYGVALSPDATQTGQPGQTIVYSLTITNTGNMADTFNLVPTGHTWPAVLSTGSVALPSGGSSTFTVAVTIPANLASSATDTVAVTVTSQADSAASDSAVLTTRYLGAGYGYAVCMPVVMRLP